MTKGFAIGNGLSREGFDLERLRCRGVSIGCNRIWHDFEPDYVVSLDDEPTAQIRAYLTEHPGAFRHITRSMHVEPGERWGRHIVCDDQEIIAAKFLNGGLNNNSGITAAAYLAEILDCEVVYLIGVDFFLPTGLDRNDLYSGYLGFSPGIVDAWNRLFSSNRDVEFIRVGPIADRDRDFFENELHELWLCETFDEFMHHVDTRRCKDAR